MIKERLSIALLVLLAVSCKNDTTFSIGQEHVGPISRETQISELKTIFASDSIVNEQGNQEFLSSNGDITVFEKGGKKLLQLSPSGPNSNAKVKFIQIFDERYKTSAGITLKSTFKDIIDAYTIKRIDNLIGSIVIFVEEGDEYFTIDKKHLAPELMFDTDSVVETTQIPDETPIKYLMIGW